MTSKQFDSFQKKLSGGVPDGFGQWGSLGFGLKGLIITTPGTQNTTSTICFPETHPSLVTYSSLPNCPNPIPIQTNVDWLKSRVNEICRCWKT